MERIRLSNLVWSWEGPAPNGWVMVKFCTSMITIFQNSFDSFDILLHFMHIKVHDSMTVVILYCFTLKKWFWYRMHHTVSVTCYESCIWRNKICQSGVMGHESRDMKLYCVQISATGEWAARPNLGFKALKEVLRHWCHHRAFPWPKQNWWSPLAVSMKKMENITIWHLVHVFFFQETIAN